MKRLVTTTYLEMTDRAQFRPVQAASDDLQFVQVELPSPELNRFLYMAVGADWCWYNRLTWDYSRWLAYLDRPELETWVAWQHGTPVGYVELESQNESNIEIAYFGVMPGFIGQGIGGALLSEAISRAWDMGAARVWVHTCDLDHPYACRNYEARGFRIYKTEEKMEEIPDNLLEPWPRANRPRLYAHTFTSADDLKELNGMPKYVQFHDGSGVTTKIGYINCNHQKCHGTLGIKGTDHFQVVYRMECLGCGFVYGANGSDVHERKCPQCQRGAEGLSYWNEF